MKTAGNGIFALAVTLGSLLQRLLGDIDAGDMGAKALLPQRLGQGGGVVALTAAGIQHHHIFACGGQPLPEQFLPHGGVVALLQEGAAGFYHAFIVAVALWAGPVA